MRTIKQLLEQARTEEYVSVEALAVYYGCSVKTIWSAIRRYHLPGVLKVGRAYRIPRQAVRALEAEWRYRQDSHTLQ